MVLARGCGRTKVHLGNSRKREGFRCYRSPHPAAEDFFHSLLAASVVASEVVEEAGAARESVGGGEALVAEGTAAQFVDYGGAVFPIPELGMRMNVAATRPTP